MRKNGFTLIELMIAIVVISVLAGIGYPSYTAYTQKKDLAVAKQTALQLSAELEKFKNKNFSYKGFNPTYLYSDFDHEASTLYLPKGSTQTTALFRLSIKDLSSGLAISSTDTAATGQNWAIIVERMPLTGSLIQPKNYDLLLTSTGIKCMTRTANVVKEIKTCGGDHADW